MKVHAARIFRNIIIAGLLVVTLFPLLWIFLTALKLPRDIMTTAILFDPVIRNFQRLFQMPEFLSYFRNSLLIATASTAIGITIAMLASYAVTRFTFPFKLDTIVLSFLLFTRMIFPMALAIPFYRLSRMVGMHDTVWAVLLVQTSINIPFGVWMLRAAFLDFPISIEESALIDGATISTILLKIAIPMIKPAIAATAIFMFMLSWNDYLFAVTLSSTPRAATIPVGLARFVQENIVRWEMMSAGATVFILPVFVVAYAVQNRLIRGFTAGTVKG